MASPSAARPARRRGFRELIAVVAVQSLGNTMSTSFWVVYLVSPPQDLPFSTAVLVWLVAFGLAMVIVAGYGRGRPIPATASMTVGLGAMAIGHLSFAFLPPLAVVVAAGAGFGIYIPAFWLPLNILLAQETTAANRAGRMAGVTATFTIVSVAAPAFGGLLAQAFGFRALFVTAASVVTANLILVRSLAQRDETHRYALRFRAAGTRTNLAFLGQGAVDGLWFAATPLATFFFTTAALELGLLFAFFSLAAGAATYVLGVASDRIRTRRPFLLLGPFLSVPAALGAAAFVSVRPDLGSFALSVGALSMTTSLAPSFIFTVLVDRMEDSLPAVSATREFLLNVSRTAALGASVLVLALGAGVEALYVFLAGAVLLEALAR